MVSSTVSPLTSPFTPNCVDFGGSRKVGAKSWCPLQKLGQVGLMSRKVGRFMRNVISNTVFHPIGHDWSPDKVLAVLYHRSAATLYLIYFFWAIASIFGSIPSIVHAQGDIIQIFFSVLVTPMALLAFIGALYFPKRARLEMYSAASLVTLVIIYEVFVAIYFFEGYEAAGVAFILNLSHLIIPASRIVFIYVTLIKQAGDQK